MEHGSGIERITKVCTELTRGDQLLSDFLINLILLEAESPQSKWRHAYKEAIKDAAQGKRSERDED